MATGREGHTSEGGAQRVLLVAAPSPSWTTVIDDLEADGYHFELIPPDEANAEAARCADRRDTVAVIDFTVGWARSVSALVAFHRLARLVPVAVVLPRTTFVSEMERLADQGASALVLEPVDADRIRAALDDAVEYHGRRPDRSVSDTPPKILIVDDDADFRASTTTLLEAEGYTVICATNGQEGLAQVRAESPDLIVLDIMMENDWAGYEVNQAIKHGNGFESVRRTPILMVSSVSIDPATRFGLSAEVGMVTADEYLTKPVDIPLFLELIRRLLGQPHGSETSRRT